MLTRTGHKKPTLADVDGTVKGKVQLMSVKLVDGLAHDTEQMSTHIEEGEYDEDPWTFAMGLMRGIEKDWPHHEWAIVGNWRARYLRWAHTMQRILPHLEHTPQDYIDTYQQRED